MDKPKVAPGEIWASQWYDKNVFPMPCCAPSGSKSSAAHAASPGQVPQKEATNAYAPSPVKKTPIGTRIPANAV